MHFTQLLYCLPWTSSRYLLLELSLKLDTKAQLWHLCTKIERLYKSWNTKTYLICRHHWSSEAIGRHFFKGVGVTWMFQLWKTPWSLQVDNVTNDWHIAIQDWPQPMHRIFNNVVWVKLHKIKIVQLAKSSGLYKLRKSHFHYCGGLQSVQKIGILLSLDYWMWPSQITHWPHWPLLVVSNMKTTKVEETDQCSQRQILDRSSTRLSNLPDLSKLHNLETLYLESGPYLKRMLNGSGNLSTSYKLDVSYCCLLGNSLDFSNAFCSGEIWVDPWHVHCGYVEIAKGLNDSGAKRWLWGTKTMIVVVTRNAIWRGKCNVFFHMLKVSLHKKNQSTYCIRIGCKQGKTSH